MAFNLSVCEMPNVGNYSLVALLCSLSTARQSRAYVGPHMLFPYSKCGLTRVVYSALKTDEFIVAKVFLMIASIQLALFTAYETCS